MLKRYNPGHPSVTGSHTSGAIGMMAVKKTKDGVFLYFAHNTESFVSLDKSPSLVTLNSAEAFTDIFAEGTGFHAF